jgi:hypothetical protein
LTKRLGRFFKRLARPIGFGALLLGNTLSANGLAQVPSQIQNQERTNPAHFAPPVHIAPVRRPVQVPAERVSKSTTQRPKSVDHRRAPASAIGTGVPQQADTQLVSVWQNIDEPFETQTRQNQDQIRISQTPASPATRPRENVVTQPQRLESILPNQELMRQLDEDAMNLDLLNSPSNRELRIDQPFAQPISNPRGLSGAMQDDEDEFLSSRFSKSCGEYREELLGRRIEDIAVDVSPPPNVKNLPPRKVTRQWKDTLGQHLAAGTLIDIRRGYIIIDSNGELLKISMARLGEADFAAVASAWELPDECVVETGIFTPRCWEPQTVTWYASNLCHKPLYFEHVQLERYGHSAGPIMGPVRATAHFFGCVLMFPYHTAINPPNECQYALGYYRPGNCAPWLVDPFPISLRGAARQGAVVAGGFYLF